MLTTETSAVFTVISANHLAYARTLADSLRENDPNIRFIVVLVDRPPQDFKRTDEPFTLVLAEDLGIENWRRLTFQYTALELCCAVKLLAAKHMFAVSGFERLLYLDSDMLVCAPLDTVFSQLDDADIVLTPHLRAPLPIDGKLPDELTICQAGAFNAGQIALRASKSADALLDWWQTKVSRHCVSDLAAGLFVDQAWLSLVPGLFDNVAIDRSPGHNAAYWNLQGRDIDIDLKGKIRIDGEPLVTFHFSGIDPDKPDQLSRYQDRNRLQDFPAIEALARKYSECLFANGHLDCSRWDYGHAKLSDGTPIDDAWREALRSDDKSRFAGLDPFDVAATPHLGKLYKQAARNMPGRKDWMVSAHQRTRRRRNRWRRLIAKTRS